MRFESRTWFLLSLLLFAGAIYFWKRGNDYESRKSKIVIPGREKEATNSPSARNAGSPGPFQLLSRLDTNSIPSLQAPGSSPASASPASAAADSTVPTNRFPFRLSNSKKSIRELTHTATALLMNIAFIDTSEKASLSIPEHLRSSGDPGSYIVQARGPIENSFRERLQTAGANIISYVPHNAYLVRLTSESAQRLGTAPEIQAVLPFEPYYKLDSALLPLAVKKEPLSPDDWLRVTAFPGEAEALNAAIANLGGEIVGEGPTPFGRQLLVKPTPDSLPAIAQVASAQIIERYHHRELLTDLTRVVIGLSPSGSSPTNYLNLTGTNVLININDSGVDATNPDLAGRIFADRPEGLTDLVAHGTHVAGIIAGSGARSSSVASAPPGSETNANFRGIAPKASLFSLPFRALPEVGMYLPEVHPFLNDSYLVETAARTNLTYSRRRSGPMVSNNSWSYVGATEYDSSSAQFDAAVRDAITDGSGSQPMVFVFAAGNSGEGNDAGEGGEANSISSPANGKNVITVGAAEHLRNITNAVFTTNTDGSISTNAPFFPLTDSVDQVAAFSSRGNVGIGTEGEFGRFKPDLVAPGVFTVSTRSKDWNLDNEVDPASDQYEILKDLNEPLGPTYRYETGTSQAAPVVSGMLALMQEFFEQRLPNNLRRTNSPALLKALLINGARSLGSIYDFQVQNSANYQGWGLVNLTNTLPSSLSTQPEARWPVRFFDQVTTNGLATGQSKSWSVALATNAQEVPLRVTLVWTDPPGNPNAAIKLVNDLDLVVSNTVSGEVFYGNDIREGSDFTQAASVDETVLPDVINNVENVFIREPASSNFVVTVTAKRVNVNAVPNYNQVTGRINDIVQDYALVISTGDTTVTNALTVTAIAPPPEFKATAIPMTNGVPLLNERVGANSSLGSTRAGFTNQWHFYVFTNIFITNEVSSLTNGTNVAFVTFLPPNVGQPRTLSSDIDLYVSKDPRLVDLVPAVVDSAWSSVTRGGTEYVVFTNAAIGDVYYIGVKSEDQQGAEYGLIALSSDQPFEENQNGARILHGMPVPQTIPDGTANNPGRATVIAIGISPITVQRVTVTNVLSHEDVGDLSVILDHERDSVVLHNHTLNNGFPSVTNAFFVYDDQGFSQGFGTRRSDGPGSLNDFAGASGTGVWIMNFIDNAPSHTGRAESVTLRIEPFQNADLGAAGSAGIDGTVGPEGTTCYYVDVPPEATNLIVNVSQVSGPLELFISHGGLPTPESFDKSMLINPPGGTLMYGAQDEPVPLGVGRYFVCLHNPNLTTVNFHIGTEFQLGVGLDFRRNLVSTNVVPLLDDGTIASSLHIPVDKQVADVQVKVRIDHPRSSDLVLHLVSPQGTRLLLAENRGGIDSSGYGSGFGTNISYTIFTEDTNLIANLNPIKFALPPWTNLNLSTNLAAFTNSFEGADPGTYLTNETFAGWTVTQGQVQLHSSGDTLGVAAHTGTNFVELENTVGTAASISTSFATVPGKDYALSFYYQRNPSAVQRVQSLFVDYGTVKFIEVPDFGWQSTNIIFTASKPLTDLRLGSLTSGGPLLDTVTVGDVVVGTNVYVLPEESLDIFQGERALGDWTLEVSDTRRGPTGSRGSLINWELQIEYGNPPGRGITLTNGFASTNSIVGTQTNFFVVDTCELTTVAFATLIGPIGKLNLLIDRNGFPTGNPDTDDYVPLINDTPLDGSPDQGVATIQLSSNPHHPAPLIPGTPLFFAVHNLNLGETNTYDFRISFDNDTCHGERPVIRLTNDVPYTNIVAPSAALFDYYVFNVSPAAIEAEFEVRPVNGDVGLVLSYGRPLPDLSTFAYKSDQVGITNELIVLTNGSSPVSLLSGDWYLGVYNNSTNLVTYDVRASQIIDTNINLIPLTNGISRNFTLLQGEKLTNYFLFEVLDPVPGIRFELTNLNGNADLFIGYNTLPSPTNYFSSNSASPSQPITFDVLTNAALTNLRGNWVLSVVPKDPVNLQFDIKATILSLTNTVPTTNRVFDPDISVSTTNICFSWPATLGLQYQLEGKTNLSDTSWSIFFGPVTATNTLMSFCLPLPPPFNFFRGVELGTGTNPPPTGNVIDPSVTVSTNSICLSWPSTVGVTYQVQGKQTVTDLTWTNLSPVLTATNTVSTYCLTRPTPYQFFQVIEGTGGGTTNPPPTGDIIDPSVAVSTNSICLSWPSTVGVTYQVQGKQTVTESTWASLSPVLTATNTITTYCITRPTPYQFFQVIEGTGGGTTNPPPPAVIEIIALEDAVSFPNTLSPGTNLTITSSPCRRQLPASTSPSPQITGMSDWSSARACRCLEQTLSIT